MLAVLGLDRGGLQTGDVRASEGLGYGKADKLLASKDLGDDARFELRRAKVEDGRKADNLRRFINRQTLYRRSETYHATLRAVSVTASANTSKLLGNHKLVEVVKLRGWVQ